MEQDALLGGNGLIDHCIAHMKKPFMFGSSDGTKQALQQSLFIIRRDGMTPFITALQGLRSTCNKLAPETKFALVWKHGFWRDLLARLKKWQTLPLPAGGRSRLLISMPNTFISSTALQKKLNDTANDKVGHKPRKKTAGTNLLAHRIRTANLTVALGLRDV